MGFLKLAPLQASDPLQILSIGLLAWYLISQKIRLEISSSQVLSLLGFYLSVDSLCMQCTQLLSF